MPLAGVTAIETNAGAVTVKVVLPVFPLKPAEILEVPIARVVPRPLLSMVAVDVVADAQVTVEVMS